MWSTLLPYTLLATGAGLICAQQSSKLPPLCDLECQKSCDAPCQAIIQRVYEAEAMNFAGNVKTDPFYALPSGFPFNFSAQPGDMLRWQDIPADQLAANWTVPGGLSLSRFMYVTVDMDGKPIPATGFALLPFESLEPTEKGERRGKRKLRTVVWTRGTAGGANPNCATSNHKALYAGWRGPFNLAQQGYAVIAPDYAGHGADTGFVYAAGWLHAGDAAYSLIAARKVLHMLSHEWVVMGFSEGGQASWRTNERVGAEPAIAIAAGKLIGTVTVAPALRPGNPILGNIGNDPTSAFVNVYGMQILETLYPGQFKLTDFLGEKALQRLKVLNGACQNMGGVAFNGLSMADIFKANYTKTHIFRDWEMKCNNPGPHRLASPMLAVHGMADFVSANSSIYDANITCSAFPQSQIQLRLYHDMSHFQTFEAAKPFMFQWVADRFNAVPLTNKGCIREEVTALTDHASNASLSWAAQILR